MIIAFLHLFWFELNQFFSHTKTNSKLLSAQTSRQLLVCEAHVHSIALPHMQCACRVIFLQVCTMCLCVTYFLPCKVRSQTFLPWIYSQAAIVINILLLHMLSAINCQNVPFSNATSRSGNPRLNKQNTPSKIISSHCCSSILCTLYLG